MSRIKNSDCFKCKKWMAECECYSHPYCCDYYGDEIDAMQAECSLYFEALGEQETETLPF